MCADVVGMAARERERAHVVRLVVARKLKQSEAADRLGMTVRQVKRLARSWRKDGDAGLVSKRRRRVSTSRMDSATQVRIEGLLRGKYADAGPTLATEKRLEREGVAVSRETIRQTQIKLGIPSKTIESKLGLASVEHHGEARIDSEHVICWVSLACGPKAVRHKRVFQPRERRPRFGEMIQIDGRPHDGFEGRAAKCTLIVFIDDATSRLTSLLFAPTETTEAYSGALKRHILAHGLPLTLYSDKYGVFRVNAKEAATGDGKTEFNRVTDRLKIEQICAHAPQA